MKKNIVYIVIALLSFSVYSQKLSDKEINKLNYLNVETSKLDLQDLNIQSNLNKILDLDRKRKTNKTVAIVLTSIAASGIVLGGIVLANKNNEEGKALSNTVGGLVMGGGAIYGGISIPFWSASKKRKKERDQLIKMF